MDRLEASKLRDLLKETKLKTRTEKYVVKKDEVRR